MGGGYFTRTKTALQAPSSAMTWTQLAAATVFVIMVALAWRQTVKFIIGEL